MSKIIQTAIAHIADVNQDGKIDKKDLELIGKLVAAEAEQAGGKLVDLAEAGSSTLVAKYKPLWVVGGSFLAGAVVTALGFWRWG